MMAFLLGLGVGVAVGGSVVALASVRSRSERRYEDAVDTELAAPVHLHRHADRFTSRRFQ